MTSFEKENIFYGSALFITLGIVYSPCLYFQYIYHDEVTLLINQQSFLPHPNAFIEMQISRPGGAAIMTFYDWFLNSVDSIQITRWICLLEFSICARICMRFFQKFLQNPIIAFLAAVLLFTLPPFQVFISWSGTVALHTTLLLSTITAALIYSRLENHPRQPITQFLKHHAPLPLILFVLTLLVYPAIAMFYWAMLALMILGQSFEQQKRSTIVFYTIGFTGLGLYAVTLAIFKTIYQTGRGIYDPYNFCADISQKIEWFFRTPLTNALNFHSIYPQTWLAISAAALITLSLLILLLKNKPSFPRMLFYAVLFFSLLVLSFLPNLFAGANIPFYRCSSALSAIILVAAVWSIHKAFFEDIKLPLYLFMVFPLFFIGTQTAFSNVLNHRALPSTIELNEFKIATRYLNFDRFKNIHIIRPEPSRWKRNDEFGTLTTGYFHNIAPLFTRIAEANGQKIEFEKPHLTSHFVRGDDYPEDIPDKAIINKRVHIYLKEPFSKYDIHLPEHIPPDEIIMDMRRVNH